MRPPDKDRRILSAWSSSKKYYLCIFEPSFWKYTIVSPCGVLGHSIHILMWEYSIIITSATGYHCNNEVPKYCYHRRPSSSLHLVIRSRLLFFCNLCVFAVLITTFSFSVFFSLCWLCFTFDIKILFCWKVKAYAEDFPTMSLKIFHKDVLSDEYLGNR